MRADWQRLAEATGLSNRFLAGGRALLASRMLVDTSVWVDHLRRSNATLVGLLEQAQVWTHAYVIGELACGNLAQRDKVLNALAALPQAPVASHDEVLAFLDTHRLMGHGLGWIDVHLLASAKLARLPFWTLDKRLAAVATTLQLQS
jgi:predicted nucleic acid-binding protein